MNRTARPSLLPPSTCPCCGQPFAGRLSIADLANTLRLSGQQARIVTVLARRPGQWVHIDQIVDALYSDDPTGGPLTARNVIAQRLTQLRPLLRAAGVAVEARWGGRGERDSYRRLVRVAP